MSAHHHPRQLHRQLTSTTKEALSTASTMLSGAHINDHDSPISVVCDTPYNSNNCDNEDNQTTESEVRNLLAQASKMRESLQCAVLNNRDELQQSNYGSMGISKNNNNNDDNITWLGMEESFLIRDRNTHDYGQEEYTNGVSKNEQKDKIEASKINSSIENMRNECEYNTEKKTVMLSQTDVEKIRDPDILQFLEDNSGWLVRYMHKKDEKEVFPCGNATSNEKNNNDVAADSSIEKTQNKHKLLEYSSSDNTGLDTPSRTCRLIVVDNLGKSYSICMATQQPSSDSSPPTRSIITKSDNDMGQDSRYPDSEHSLEDSLPIIEIPLELLASRNIESSGGIYGMNSTIREESNKVRRSGDSVISGLFRRTEVLLDSEAYSFHCGPSSVSSYGSKDDNMNSLLEGEDEINELNMAIAGSLLLPQDDNSGMSIRDLDGDDSVKMSDIPSSKSSTLGSTNNNGYISKFNDVMEELVSAIEEGYDSGEDCSQSSKDNECESVEDDNETMRSSLSDKSNEKIKKSAYLRGKIAAIRSKLSAAGGSVNRADVEFAGVSDIQLNQLLKVGEVNLFRQLQTLREKQKKRQKEMQQEIDQLRNGLSSKPLKPPETTESNEPIKTSTNKSVFSVQHCRSMNMAHTRDGTPSVPANGIPSSTIQVQDILDRAKAKSQGKILTEAESKRVDFLLSKCTERDTNEPAISIGESNVHSDNKKSNNNDPIMDESWILTPEQLAAKREEEDKIRKRLMELDNKIAFMQKVRDSDMEASAVPRECEKSIRDINRSAMISPSVSSLLKQLDATGSTRSTNVLKSTSSTMTGVDDHTHNNEVRVIPCPPNQQHTNKARSHQPTDSIRTYGEGYNDSVSRQCQQKLGNRYLAESVESKHLRDTVRLLDVELERIHLSEDSLVTPPFSFVTRFDAGIPPSDVVWPEGVVLPSEEDIAKLLAQARAEDEREAHIRRTCDAAVDNRYHCDEMDGTNPSSSLSQQEVEVEAGNESGCQGNNGDQSLVSIASTIVSHPPITAFQEALRGRLQRAQQAAEELTSLFSEEKHHERIEELNNIANGSDDLNENTTDLSVNI